MEPFGESTPPTIENPSPLAPLPLENRACQTNKLHVMKRELFPIIFINQFHNNLARHYICTSAHTSTYVEFTTIVIQYDFEQYENMLCILYFFSYTITSSIRHEEFQFSKI